MKHLIFAIVTCLVSNISGFAQADIVVLFSDGSTTATNFDVAVNSTNTFFVSVMETDSNDELSSDGLVGFGLRADYAAITGNKAEVVANSVDSAFDTPTDESFTSTVINLAGVDIDFASDGFPMGTSILLGQFDVNVSAAGVTEFVFGDYSDLSDFATPSAVDLDPVIFVDSRTFSMTVSAVPEPTAFVAMGLMGVCGLIQRRRVRRSV